MIKFLFQIIPEIILFILLFFNSFVLKNVDRIYTLIIITTFLILTFIRVRYKKPIKNKGKSTNFIVGGISLITIGVMYFSGIFSGFNNGYGILSKTPIGIFNILIVFAIVIVTELLRYMLSLNEPKNKKIRIVRNIIMLMCYVIIDLSIVNKIFGFGSFYSICEFVCIFLVQSISKNIFLMNTSKKYGYMTCLVYRIIMDLYAYIMPIKPKVNVFIESVIFTVMPYVNYIILKNANEKKSIQLSKKRSKTSDLLINAVELTFIGILVALVSCEFKYGMLAVGSGSMTGTINKGDAIIYEKYDKKNKIEAGQVIVFNKDNTMIIHRIQRVIPVDGNEYVYQTKGDANKNIDNWLVKPEEIIGKVNSRVLWIAWPSVLLNEIFG